jgi:fructose transport system permease protein
MSQATAFPQPPLYRRVLRFLALPAVSPLIVLLVACIVFGLGSDVFFTGPNISLIVQQVSAVGALAIGQTLIILTSGIDLSNGVLMAYGSVIMAKLAVVSGVNPVLAIILGFLVCIAFGLFNGTLIAALGLPPFIVTLGTYGIVFALTRIYSSSSINNLPSELTFLGSTFSVGATRITYYSVVLLVLYFIVWYVLQSTPVGRHIYALGNEPEAARLTGIPVGRLIVGIYTVAGFFYAMAALFLIGRSPSGNPQAGLDSNLESITAVVLGGTSLFGGRGHIMGTLLGVLIVGTIRNGLQLIGVQSNYQVLFTGVLVILAVAVDQLSRRGQA